MEDHAAFMQFLILMNFFIREFLYVWARKYNHYRQSEWRYIDSYGSLCVINYKTEMP